MSTSYVVIMESRSKRSEVNGMHVDPFRYPLIIKTFTNMREALTSKEANLWVAMNYEPIAIAPQGGYFQKVIKREVQPAPPPFELKMDRWTG